MHIKFKLFDCVQRTKKMTQQSDLQTERIYMAEHDKLKLQQAIRIQTQTKKHQRICLVSLLSNKILL